MMKRFTLTMMGLLLLLGGVSLQAQTLLVLKGGVNCDFPNGDNPTSGVIQFRDKRVKYSYASNGDWVSSGADTYTFKITLGSSNNEECILHIAALNAPISDAIFNGDVLASDKIVAENSIEVSDNAILSLTVSGSYSAIIIWQTSNTDWRKVNIDSFTREEGGGGSTLTGKINITHNIPGKKVLFSDNFDSNINNWQQLNQNNGSVDWDGTTGHDANGCMKVVNNSSRNTDQWKIQRKVSINPNISSGTTFYVTFYIKCESGTGSIRCSTTGNAQYQDDQNVTTEWQQIVWEVTAKGNIDGLCLDMAHTENTYYIDDVEIYENAGFGGSNEFTTADQVANIASSAFSGLNEGDYICADVTGTPSVIKLTCNGTEYALTQFNSSNLWGIKVTSAMATALKANASEFKGYPLTLNSIDIYKTVALGEGDNSTALASKINNVVVELTRSFVANTWNTICLPFVPTDAQATELFGSGYKLAKFTASGTNSMMFTTFDLSEFEAGKPYLVRPTATVTHTDKVLANVSITETEGSEDEDNNGYKFKGSFEPTFFSENLNLYRFIASGNELQTPTGGTLKSLRCYFEYPSVGGARSFTIDEEATGVDSVQSSQCTVHSYYNLNGQRVDGSRFRVNGSGLKPGLYIVNGKKVVIK